MSVQQIAASPERNHASPWLRLRGALRPRLALRLALSVFLSILVVEAAILVPSYRNYKASLLTELYETGLATFVGAFTVHDEKDPQRLLAHSDALTRNSRVVGGALFTPEGAPLGYFGERPGLAATGDLTDRVRRHLSADGSRYEVVWPAAQTGLPVSVVGRFDASWIAQELRNFIWRITGLVLVISITVCGTTMLIVNRSVLRPILLLRSRLEAAAADPTDPESLHLPTKRQDELGTVMCAFNAMSRSIANHVAASREAREALAQAKADLEARVSERTHELVAANESLQREISERRRAEAQLKHDAFHDRLTQLPNRELFVDRIQHWISRAGRANEAGFAVILVNIDRFAVVNDSLGHQAGDQLLALVAERLRRALRPGDTLARLAGDDFALLVESAGTPERATACAHRLREQLIEPFMIDAEAVYCTCSMGITTSGFGYIRAGAMIQDAQLALHQAKRAGKDRFELFHAAMRSSPTRILKVEADLRRALERGNELVLHYQPIISVRTGQVAGFEALMRWQHPERGLIPPAEFIPLAEDTGLIVPMGRWVLAEAVRQVDAWSQKFPEHRDLFASVNVSSRQLIDPHLVDDVRSALDTVSLQPSNLKLEVTESLLIRNPELALSILRELKDIGAKLCIDDFGTGYSSLSYLRRFPFDVLKIDRSFVREMAEGRQSFEIVRTITDLARILNMRVVAEGAETEDVVERLNALGCDFVQGFFFAPPVEAHHAEKFLEEERRPWRLKYRPQPVSLMAERMAG